MVRLAYKQTEVGEIPEDWDVKNLKEEVTLLSGHHVLAQYCNLNGHGVPYLTGPADFPNGKIQQTKFTTKPTTICAANDLLVTVKGSGAGTLIQSDAIYCISRQLMAIRVNNWNSHFLYYSLLQNASRIKAASAGLIPGLARSDILEQQIPVPLVYSEQKAIAKALSDVDELIVSLEKLIAKKRDIKTATMQQLLTGKKRLPGFGEGKGYKQTELGEIPEDWSITTVSQITKSHKQGFYTKEKYVNTGIRLVRITDLYNPHIDYESMPLLAITENDFNQYKIQKGDFLFARSGAIGRYGIVEDDIDAIFGSYIIRFNFDESILLNRCFGYLFETNIIWRQLLSITQGSSNINIKANNIKSLQIPIPDMEEQKSVSRILTDMDSELHYLTAQLEKTKAIKQGMMQELLTGRTRLVEPQAAYVEEERLHGT